ncbi:6-phosphogluconolactonase, partial [Vibrio parahaemolyticus]|nr:6-phosphogluconolactonase [Vibrio parahaemolyticus]
DERCVAPDDAESNYGEANALLFSQIDIPAGNIHRILGENEPQAEAQRFAQEMADVIPSENGTPVFDWILLGVGADGHTASLFPGKTNYDDENLSVVASHPESGQLRVSKTAKVLEAAKRISYLVLGAGKAEIVYEIHTTPAEDLPYPA